MTEAIQVLVKNQCLLWIQLFAFWQQKNWLPARGLVPGQPQDVASLEQRTVHIRCGGQGYCDQEPTKSAELV